MRLPRMTTRRWMVLIAVVAVDLTLIVQRVSASLTTFAIVVISPAMLLLFMFAADD